MTKAMRKGLAGKVVPTSAWRMAEWRFSFVTHKIHLLKIWTNHREHKDHKEYPPQSSFFFVLSVLFVVNL